MELQNSMKCLLGRLLQESDNLLIHEHPVKIAFGGEVLPDPQNRALAGVRETLLDPDNIALDASADRLELGRC